MRIVDLPRSWLWEFRGGHSGKSCSHSEKVSPLLNLRYEVSIQLPCENTCNTHCNALQHTAIHCNTADFGKYQHFALCHSAIDHAKSLKIDYAKYLKIDCAKHLKRNWLCKIPFFFWISAFCAMSLRNWLCKMHTQLTCEHIHQEKSNFPVQTSGNKSGTTHCNTLQHTATHCNTLQQCVLSNFLVQTSGNKSGTISQKSHFSLYLYSHYLFSLYLCSNYLYSPYLYSQQTSVNKSCKISQKSTL